MMDSKKILITTETQEFFILHNTDEMPLKAYCPACSQFASFLGIEGAVNASSFSVREIISGIDAGLIHAAETKDRHLLICETSLQSFLNSKEIEK